MTLRLAAGAGVVLGVVVLAAVFEVCDRREINLFHIGDTA